jgi:hypothetical protein
VATRFQVMEGFPLNRPEEKTSYDNG